MQKSPIQLKRAPSIIGMMDELYALKKLLTEKIGSYESKIDGIKRLHEDMIAKAHSVESRLNQIAVIQGPEGPQGKPGATMKGDPGEPAVIDYGFLITEIMDKLPAPKDGVSPTIDEEKLLEALFKRIKQKGLKLSDIVGLEETITSFSNRMMHKEPYMHGGGDTVAAGSGVTITNTNGTKVISSTGGAALSIIAVAGTIDDSNVSFTAASEPTLLNVNGAFYQKTGGSYTWTYVAGTITLNNPVGTGGQLFGI